jgi:hypothetical protein
MRLLLAAFACAIVLLPAAASASDAVLYRIFLRDGGAFISYGEFAHVAGSVVFSVPLGDTTVNPDLRLVSIPEDAVDWPRTDRYTDAVRARRYADTRGEEEFAILANQVAGALNDVMLTSDPKRRIAMVDEARTNLAKWPAEHFGYRGADVAWFSEELESIVADMRASAGQSQFNLSLVSGSTSAAPEPLLPSPSAEETFGIALGVARAASDPGERMSLLRAISASLSGPAASGGWAGDLKLIADTQLSYETSVSNAYATLSTTALATAAFRAKKADVVGVDRAIRSVLDEDDRLGRKRPSEMASILAALDLQLDAAKKLQAARAAWQSRQPALSAYRKKVESPMWRVRRHQKGLADLETGASRSYTAMAADAAAAARELSRIVPPPEMATVHGLLTTSVRMMQRAANAANALSSSDPHASDALLREASSAAAGAWMMFQSAVTELTKLTSLPQLR